MKKNDLNGYITGIRVEENRPRALVIFQKGVYYKAKRDRLWRFHPVAIWSLTQLMEYVRENEIPLNPLYERGLPRVGCQPCTGFSNWRAQLSSMNPKYYKWLNREYQKSKGSPTLWEYENIPFECPELGI